jgi:hypothetical protein
MALGHCTMAPHRGEERVESFHDVHVVRANPMR